MSGSNLHGGEPMSAHDEPIQACAGCGGDTRPGTRLYSDRRTTPVEGGDPIFLCGDCNERAVSHFGRQPTEKDMVQIAARGSAFGFGGAGGGFGAGGGG
jgi:hypothetical protein